MVDPPRVTGGGFCRRVVHEHFGNLGCDCPSGYVSRTQSNAYAVLEYCYGGWRIGRLGRSLVHWLAGHCTKTPMSLVLGKPHACGLLLCIATLSLSPLTGRLKALCAGLGFLGAVTLISIQVATPAPPTFVVEEFPASSIETIEGEPAGVLEEPEMFDAPLEGDDVFTAPATDSSAMLMPDFEKTARNWFRAGLAFTLHPAYLFTAQVGTSPAGQGTPSCFG